MKPSDNFGFQDSASIFLGQQLTKFLPQLWEKKYGDLNILDIFGGSVVNFGGSANLGGISSGMWAQELVYQFGDVHGQMKPLSATATDIPSVSVSGGSIRSQYGFFGTSVSYFITDVQAAMSSGVPLQTRLMESAMKVAADHVNQVLLSGYDQYEMYGIINAPGVELLAAVTGDWPTATPIQMYNDVITAVTTFLENSKGSYKPNTIVMSLRRYLLLSTTPMVPGFEWNTNTVLETIMATLDTLLPDGYVLRAAWELTDLGTNADTDIMILAHQDAGRTSTPAFFMDRPMILQSLTGAQLSGVRYNIPMLTQHTGVIAPYPFAILVLDNV